MATSRGRTNSIFSPHLKLSSRIIMNDLRQRYDAVKLADDSRNALLEDLLRKVDEQQKIMDRNAFALVLIDGDCMNVIMKTIIPKKNIDI